MAYTSIKTASRFDVDQIFELLRMCKGSRLPKGLSVQSLDDALFGREKAVKALVGRQNMQVIACLFYQTTFLVTECRYVTREISSHVHSGFTDTDIEKRLREYLQRMDRKGLNRAPILMTIADAKTFA